MFSFFFFQHFRKNFHLCALYLKVAIAIDNLHRITRLLYFNNKVVSNKEFDLKIVMENSNKSEFVTLLTANYYKIHSFIMSLVPNKADSEDVLQSTVTYMWEHFDDFEPGSRFLAWAFVIAKYQVLTYRKKLSRSKVCFNDDLLDLILAEYQQKPSEIDIKFEKLEQCLSKLNEQDQKIIKRRFQDDSKVRSIAQEFDTTENRIYKRIARIKDALLKCVNRPAYNGGRL